MRNLSMLMDYYEMTMANGVLANKKNDTIAYFDMFFRRVPDNGGFAIMAGLRQLIDYLKELSFSEDDIDYLREKKIFSEDFLSFLRDFKFTCDMWAIPEGTPIFPGEPIITFRGPIMQLYLIETMVLLTINHQSLIATKSNRVVRAAQGRPVLEFGSRRAHGADAAIYGARAAYIGGCTGTACVLAGKEFDIAISGTMAHSWVQLFDSEYEAFKAYATAYPDSCMLLVDTYSTLKSGIPNAIKVFDEVLKPLGKRPVGIRIDSGDVVYLSKKARKMLDDAGYTDAKICISNSLDEYLIRDMLMQGAKIDVFGVGERLITARSEAVFGGVYKIVAIEGENGELIPRIKLSDNVSKLTVPCFKQVWRLYDNESGKALADVLTLRDEVIDDSSDYEIFDPEATWKRKRVTNFTAKPLQVKIFEGGKCVYDSPSVKELQKHRAEQVDTLWEEVQRFEMPHKYYVDLSQKLWDERKNLIEKYSKEGGK